MPCTVKLYESITGHIYIAVETPAPGIAYDVTETNSAFAADAEAIAGDLTADWTVPVLRVEEAELGGELRASWTDGALRFYGDRLPGPRAWRYIVGECGFAWSGSDVVAR